MRIGRLAPFYRWIEYAAFGRALERRRFAFLERLAGARRVLTLGEGDGRVLARLLSITPEARFEVVELSPEMIELAQRQIGRSGRVHFRFSDAMIIDWPPQEYDGVVTMFFGLLHRIGCAPSDRAGRSLTAYWRRLAGQ